MKEAVLKKLMSSTRCGSCGSCFKEIDVEVLGNSGGMWFLQVICSACDTQSLIVAIVQKCSGRGRAKNPGRVERAKYALVQRVDDEDLLDMHQFLKDFDGDFCRLFNEASN